VNRFADHARYYGYKEREGEEKFNKRLQNKESRVGVNHTRRNLFEGTVFDPTQERGEFREVLRRRITRE
jgi:hypothetical protein